MQTEDDGAAAEPREGGLEQVRDRIERVCAVLESIAKKYDEGSPESSALRDAALAYTWVHQRKQLRDQYVLLRAAYDEEIPAEIKARLRSRGIDPDALEEETGEA